MNSNTTVELPEDSSKTGKKKPLPIYVLSIIYMWSGLKGLFAGLWGPLILWLFTIDEVRKEFAKQPNIKEILESNKLLEQFTSFQYAFLAVGGLVQIIAAIYLFKMRRRALTFIISGLIIDILAFLSRGSVEGWSVALGKNGLFGFLFDWVFSFIIVYYLWTLIKNRRLKAA